MKSTLPHAATSSTTYNLEQLAPIVRYLEAVTPPSTTTTTARVQRARGGDRCQYADLIREIFGDEADKAIKIAWRESRCTAAFNNENCDRRGGHAYGPMQLCLPLHDQQYLAVGCEWQADWRDPRCSLLAAKHLRDQAGWGPWGG